MLTLLLIAGLVLIIVLGSFIKELDREIKRDIKRDARAKHLSYMPIGVPKELDKLLEKNIVSNRRYNIAALIIVDKFDRAIVADATIIGDYNRQYTLGDFAKPNNKLKANRFLFEDDILEVISNKLGAEFTEVDPGSYYELIVNNIIGGRHGWLKQEVKESFVTHINISSMELEVIANLENDELYYRAAQGVCNTKTEIDKENNINKYPDIEVLENDFNQEVANDTIAALNNASSIDEIIDALTDDKSKSMDVEFTALDEAAVSISNPSINDDYIIDVKKSNIVNEEQCHIKFDDFFNIKSSVDEFFMKQTEKKKLLDQSSNYSYIKSFAVEVGQVEDELFMEEELEDEYLTEEELSTIKTFDAKPKSILNEIDDSLKELSKNYIGYILA